MNTLSYDLVVIGSGPAGETGASQAVSFGKKVALVEKSPLVGGASANTGTIPSKTLRETALAISGLRARNLDGVDLSLRREATIGDFMYRERRVTAEERQRIKVDLIHNGVMLYHGTASFIDPHTLRVTADDGQEVRLRGETILIAVGSSPKRPAIFPFEHPRVHDSDEILKLDRLPRSLAVVGAGVIGCEYACTFAALGTKVWLIDGRDELLSFLDEEISAALEKAMQTHLGVEFLWKTRATGCACQPSQKEKGEDDILLTLDTGGTLRAEGVLVSAGRKSNTAALNLPAAGLEVGRHGVISVGPDFRTAIPHILAAGDVIGFPALASTSMEQARVAMCHAFAQGFKTEMAPQVPTGVYTIPEVGMVGAAEEDLKAQGVDYVVGRARYSQTARGLIIGSETGFLKLIFRPADMKLLGVHILGELATELVHIGVLSMLADGGAELLTQICFNFPTLGDLYKLATYDALKNRGARLAS